jgi:glycerol-3-phosphate dehydrogenase (NAD(P)+)
MGTALAIHLSKKGTPVCLWGRNPDKIRRIRETRENTPYLPGVPIPDAVAVTADLDRAMEETREIVMCVPSHQVRGVIRQVRPYIKPQTMVVNAAKGLELESLKRMSQVLDEELIGAESHVCALGGPSHAEVICRGIPTAVVVSSKEHSAALAVQEMFVSSRLRVYTNADLVGVELGAALKNVIAVAVGITTGQGYGDNAKAALITRGLAEISRLGIACHADPLTFMGLAGIGDLIVTCTSMHSRNFRAGMLLGQGHTLDQALEKVGMVVEGVLAARAAQRMSQIYQVSMPICDELYRMLFEGKKPEDAVEALMLRQPKGEKEEVALQNVPNLSYALEHTAQWVSGD